jgi:hypothetical protein
MRGGPATVELALDIPARAADRRALGLQMAMEPTSREARHVAEPAFSNSRARIGDGRHARGLVEHRAVLTIGAASEFRTENTNVPTASILAGEAVGNVVVGVHGPNHGAFDVCEVREALADPRRSVVSEYR